MKKVQPGVVCFGEVLLALYHRLPIERKAEA